MKGYIHNCTSIDMCEISKLFIERCEHNINLLNLTIFSMQTLCFRLIYFDDHLNIHLKKNVAICSPYKKYIVAIMPYLSIIVIN